MRLIYAIAVSTCIMGHAFAGETHQAAHTQDALDAMAEKTGTPAPRLPPAPMSEQVQSSYGCFLTGSAGTVAAVSFGAENLVNVVAGGIVAPANPAVLAIGLLGVVFASFCTVGQALTPMALDIATRLEGPTDRVASASAALAQWVGQSFSMASEVTMQHVASPMVEMGRQGWQMAAGGCMANETCAHWVNGRMPQATQ